MIQLSSVQKLLEQAAAVKAAMAKDATLQSAIAAAASVLHKVTAQGGTIYACGNGGSACDAMHLTEELVARFKRDRDGIRAMHFMDSGTLTCWSNDKDYAGVFERYAQTFCTSNDALVVLSTSGNSKNVLRAAEAAKKRGAAVIALTGKSGGALNALADICCCIPAAETERVQEGHITIIHLWCELLEVG